MPRRKPYPSDLTNEEWAILKPLIPRQKPGGRPAVRSKREIVNAILYVLRNGGAWRALPHDFPPWNTVYYHFRQWREDGLWEQINDTLRPRVRAKAGRSASPTAGIVDSQSARTTEKGGPVGTTGRSA
jgi:transposase